MSYVLLFQSALNMISRCLSNDLKDDGIITISIHPGWAQTDMGGSSAPVKPKDSIEGIFSLLVYLLK